MLKAMWIVCKDFIKRFPSIVKYGLTMVLTVALVPAIVGAILMVKIIQMVPETSTVMRLVILLVVLWVVLTIVFILFVVPGLIALDFVAWVKDTRNPCNMEMLRKYIALKKKIGLGLSDTMYFYNGVEKKSTLTKRVVKKMEREGISIS